MIDPEKMAECKKRLEAILFASGKRMTIDELARLVKVRNRDDVRVALRELMQEYAKKEGSLHIEEIEEAGEIYWKLTVKNHMIPIINRIVSKTELPKSIIETLAYIAYKYPAKQSDIIKVRSNKAYDHLKELERTGYITRQKYGRTNLIRLTDKFFDYFDLPPDKLKERFSDFAQLEKAIEEKEAEIKKLAEENRRRQKEAKEKVQEEKKEDEALEPDLDQIEIDLVSDKGKKQKLDTYDSIPEDRPTVYQEQPKITEVSPKLGELDVIDEPIPSLAEQMKKKEPGHLGDLEMYGEEGRKETSVEEKEEVSVSSAEKRADEILGGIGSAEDIEEGEEPEEREEESTEEMVEEEPEEEGGEGIDEEIREQREAMTSTELKEGPGFTKPVEDYMEKMSDKRAEDMIMGKKEEEKEEKEDIIMPASHKREDESREDEEKGEEEPEVEEEPEDKLGAEEEIIEAEAKIKGEDADSALPPMDEFDEKKKDDDS